jgi:hypothetical protein
MLRLAPSEVLLFLLLVTFSLLTASGFWKTLGSLTYIYLFPFVVLGYALYAAFLMLRAINKWLLAQAKPPAWASGVVEQTATPTVSLQRQPDQRVEAKKTTRNVLLFLLRPFRRFMFLWCILLVVTTHTTILWLCLGVVLAHLAQQMFVIIKLLYFSPWLNENLRKIGSSLLTPFANILESLTSVTREAAPSTELRNLWNQVNLWRKILEFLKNPYLLSRWAWLITIGFLVSVYLYIAFLFSFTYYGAARIAGVPYSWLDALVASVFIPFFISDLPKVLLVKALGGLHCSLVLAVGIGTIVNFLRRHLEALRTAATALSDRFADESIYEKYEILEEKFSSTISSVPSPQAPTK